MLNRDYSTNKWYVLILSTLTLLLGMSVPTMAMPVLFKEISAELHLNLVQVGTVWSMIPLAAIIMGFISGMLVDRYGIRRVTMTALILVGILGALRGLSGSFLSLALSSFLVGVVMQILPIAMARVAAVWFSGRQHGLAQGVLATGVGVGFALGALVSASVLSPLFGSWRYVLFLYGAISVLIGLQWFFTVKEPRAFAPSDTEDKLPFRQMISKVVRIRDIWLIGFSVFGYGGCVYAIQGYLPIYLSSAGWSEINADGALAALNIAGAAGAIPLAVLSDKLGLRKAVVLPSLVIACVSSALLTVFDNAIVWLLVILIGLTRDAVIALLITMNQEKVSGLEYSGTALGMQFTIARASHAVLPPLGNSLAGIYAGAPFALWTAFAASGTILMMFVKETGWRSKKEVITSLDYDSSTL